MRVLDSTNNIGPQRGMPRNWPVHVFNILAAIECLRAYDVAINTDRLDDLWETNQVCSCQWVVGTFVSIIAVGYDMVVSIACDVPQQSLEKDPGHCHAFRIYMLRGLSITKVFL